MQRPEKYFMRFKEPEGGGEIHVVITYDSDYMLFSQMLDATKQYVTHHMENEAVVPKGEEE